MFFFIFILLFEKKIEKIGPLDILLLKLHRSKCLMDDIPKQLHISKQARKKAKNFVITINNSFSECLANIIHYHSSNWINPSLGAAFGQLNETKNPALKSRVISFELWKKIPDSEEVELVAGEIGTAVGGIYTSLTGYHTENHSGTIQLVATGILLHLCKYSVWDLGMPLSYKSTLGSKIVRRDYFVPLVLKHRNDSVLPFPTTRMIEVHQLISDFRNSLQK